MVTIHDLIHLLFPEHLPNRGALLYAKFMLSHAVRKARRVITVSERSAADLRSRYGLHAPQLQVIANGVEPAFFESTDDHTCRVDDEVLRRHQLEPGYLLFVGNPKPHKNLRRTLQAFAGARAAGLRRPLVLVGSDADALDGLDEDLREHVQPLGFVATADLPTLYRQASQLVFPSLYEGFGLPALEAMAAGTPVLTSRGSAMAEITGEVAVLVDPESVGAIQGGMLTLDREPEAQRTPRREQGRARAHQFTWARAAVRTLEVYEDALAGTNGGTEQ